MKNQPHLSPKQARFVTAYAQHHNASQAAREAGYSAGCASVTGTRLLANESVYRRIQTLEALTAIDLGVSRQRFLAELESAATLAKARGEPMAMIAAWKEIGKACGFYQAERVKVDLSRGGQAEMGRVSRLSDQELIDLISAGTAA